MKNKVLSYIDQLKTEAIEIQRMLVKIPALGPENQGDGERQKANCLLAYLKKEKFSQLADYVAPDARVSSGNRPNILAKVSGKDQNKTLWIVSHLDVVPPGDPELWESDPFDLQVKGDILTGRGVEDNHHGLVASLLAGLAFTRQDLTPRINLGLLFVADEETGNKYGLEFMLQEHPEIFSQDDLFLVPDFGRPDSKMIEVAEKGMLWLKFTVTGKQCHASTPQEGINSLFASAALILELQRLYVAFPGQDNKFDPPISTFEATKKESNVPNINTIPGQDVFYLDCRILPDYKTEDVLAECRKICTKIELKHQVKIEVEVVHQESSPPTDPGHPFVKSLTGAVQEIYQVTPKTVGVGGGTVASFLRKKGYPALVWSTILGQAHRPNEQTKLSNIIGDAKVMALLAC